MSANTPVTTSSASQPAFELINNPRATRGNPWTDAQDAILNDQALATARSIISVWPGYQVTPLHSLKSLASQLGVASLHYKDESHRFGLGSFKALGGAYAVARLLQREVAARQSNGEPSIAEILNGDHAEVISNITVCCATDGNHGRSVAWGAQTFGCQCVIYVHATVSDARCKAIEAYGARVVRTTGNYDDSVREAQRAASDNDNWYVVSDTSYPGYTETPKDVMQGYELMAAEAEEQLDAPPTHIFLQTGVGGMAAAVCAYFTRRYGAKRPSIVLADPDRAACWLESIRAGVPTPVRGDLDTMMAGLACGEVSLLAWSILSDHADAVMAIPDDGVADTMKLLAHPAGEDPPIVAGESAVGGLLALQLSSSDTDTATALGLDKNSRVLVFGTEGDTDPELYTLLVGQAGDQIRHQAGETAR